MRIVVLGSALLIAAASLGGCAGAYVAAGTGAWVASEKLTDKSPLDHASLALKPTCKSYSLYDMPPHCRR